jgi:DNA-binding HxlR family transcriptional regulator
MALLDLLGRRGALRVLWELREQGLTFRALQLAADSNPGALNSRLAELRQAGIVTHGKKGYALTADGQRLLRTLLPLMDWADDWARRTGASGSPEP